MYVSRQMCPSRTTKLFLSVERGIFCAGMLIMQTYKLKETRQVVKYSASTKHNTSQMKRH
jgi:hypothetical protein